MIVKPFAVLSEDDARKLVAYLAGSGYDPPLSDLMKAGIADLYLALKEAIRDIDYPSHVYDLQTR